MERNFNGMYSSHVNPIMGNGAPQRGIGVPLSGIQYTPPNIQYGEAEKIMNGLMALGNYASACIGVSDVNNRVHASQVSSDEDIISEVNRLKSHSKIMTFEELKEKSKFAITVNDSGRLMVDGNLFDGVIRSQTDAMEKLVEYKLGNPVTIIHEVKSNSFDSGKTALKLTKYEYCKSNPYVTKIEKSLIYESNWDNPEYEAYLAVPTIVQKEAGISQKDNIIKTIS